MSLFALITLITLISFISFISFVISTSAVALPLSSHSRIEFSADDRTIERNLPEEGCMALLDESENFTVSVQGKKLLVFNKAVLEKESMLLLECPSSSSTFTIAFVNRRETDNTQKSSIVRPRSYFRQRVSLLEKGTLANSFTLADASEKSFQAEVGLDHPNVRKKGQKITRASLNHEGENYTLGVTQNYDTTDEEIRRDSTQLRTGLYGLTTMVEFFHENGRRTKETGLVYLPLPLSLLYSFEHVRQVSFSHKLERDFDWSEGDWDNELQLAVRSKRDLGKPAKGVLVATNGNNEQASSHNFNSFYNYNDRLKFGPEVLSECLYSQSRCGLRKLGVRSEGNVSTLKMALEYAPFPHQTAFRMDYEFVADQVFSGQVQRRWPSLGFVKNQNWILPEESADTQTMASSQALLVYKSGPLQSSLLLPLATYNSPGQSSVLDLRGTWELSDATLQCGARTTEFYPKPPGKWEAYLEFTLYFSNNVSKIPLLLKEHTLAGKVISTELGSAVNQAQVVLLSQEKEIARTVSDSEGKYEFKSIPTSGSFAVRAQKGRFQGEQTLEKNLDQPAAKVNLELSTHAIFEVVFVSLKGANKSDRETLELHNFNSAAQEAIIAHEKAIYKEDFLYVPLEVEASITSGESKVPKFLLRDTALPFEWEFVELQVENIEDEVKDDQVDKGVQRNQGKQDGGEKTSLSARSLKEQKAPQNKPKRIIVLLKPRD